MTANAYSEKALVEQSAMELLDALDWVTASARDEVFGASGTFGRETAREVTLTRRVRTALAELNPGIPAPAIDLAVEELLRDRGAMDPVGANREVYRLLK